MFRARCDGVKGGNRNHEPRRRSSPADTRPSPSAFEAPLPPVMDSDGRRYTSDGWQRRRGKAQRGIGPCRLIRCWTSPGPRTRRASFRTFGVARISRSRGNATTTVARRSRPARLRRRGRRESPTRYAVAAVRGIVQGALPVKALRWFDAARRCGSLPRLGRWGEWCARGFCRSGVRRRPAGRNPVRASPTVRDQGIPGSPPSDERRSRCGPRFGCRCGGEQAGDGGGERSAAPCADAHVAHARFRCGSVHGVEESLEDHHDRGEARGGPGGDDELFRRALRYAVPDGFRGGSWWPLDSRRQRRDQGFPREGRHARSSEEIGRQPGRKGEKRNRAAPGFLASALLSLFVCERRASTAKAAARFPSLPGRSCRRPSTGRRPPGAPSRPVAGRRPREGTGVNATPAVSGNGRPRPGASAVRAVLRSSSTTKSGVPEAKAGAGQVSDPAGSGFAVLSHCGASRKFLPISEQNAVERD